MNSSVSENVSERSVGTRGGGGRKRNEFLLFPRIICLILAFCVWLYVMNMTSEDYEQTFNLIDVNVEGIEIMANNSNMSLINIEESKVNVTVRGKRSDIAKLTSEDFNAYINVSMLQTAEKHSLEVSVDLPGGVTLISTTPSVITVSTDVIKKVTVPVTVELGSYAMDSSYTIGKITTDITTIDVEGPATVLDNIAYAKAVIDLGSQFLVTSVEQRAALHLINGKTGNEIINPYVKKSADSVTAQIPLTVRLETPLTVSFADGFDQTRIKTIHITPDSVILVGDPKAIDELGTIEILTINGDTPTSVTVDLNEYILPDNVAFAATPGSVTVEITYYPEAPETTEVPPVTTSPEETTSPEVTAAPEIH